MSRRPKFAKSLELQLHGTEQRLTALRSDMGLYTWVWLRTIVPSDESQLWELLANDLGSQQPVIGLVNELSKRQGAVSADELAARKTLLREAHLFHNLDDEDLDDLALLLRQQAYIVSEDVIEQGTFDDHLYVVASGNLVVSVIDTDGSEIIITAYDQGSSFGELTLLDRQPYPASVTCVSEVTLYSLERATFLTLLYAKPQVGVEMMRYLVDHIRREMALLVWIQQSSKPAPKDGSEKEPD